MNKFRILIAIISVLAVLIFSVPAMAATTADVTITATPTYIALTVSDGGTNTWAIGTVSESSTYWYSHDNAAPAEPVTDGEGILVITNTGSVSENINLHAHNFTGGGGWTVAGAVGADTVKLGAGKTGDANKAAMLVLTTGDQEYLHELAAAAHTHGVLYMDTGTFGDGAAKSTTITYTAVQHT
jgi:hypothetical protein